ncbi:MAG: PAS domain-containing protein, partial [Halieaceae bacterium]|nr:PAS domain-containing protein [Halieaceae bacterium]
MEDRIASLPRAQFRFTNDATAEELQIAVENAMTGISWLDTDGKFRVVREGYAKMLGYDPEELLGQSWEVTVVPA